MNQMTHATRAIDYPNMQRRPIELHATHFVNSLITFYFPFCIQQLKSKEDDEGKNLKIQPIHFMWLYNFHYSIRDVLLAK